MIGQPGPRVQCHVAAASSSDTETAPTQCQCMAAGTAPWLVQLPRVTAVTENPVQVGAISRLWLYVGFRLSSLHSSRFCFRSAERRSAGDARERADLTTERERELMTEKRAGKAERDFRCSILSRFDLRAPSSTDVTVLLLNQPKFSGGGGLAKTWRKRLLYDPLHRLRFELTIALFVLCFATRCSLVCSLQQMVKVTSPRCFFHFSSIFTTEILCKGNPAWLAVFLETCT